jgi:hypothetical protein
MRFLFFLMVLGGCAAGETRQEPKLATTRPPVTPNAPVRPEATSTPTVASTDTIADAKLDSSRTGRKPGQRISVDIQIRSVTFRADTVAITYRVKNLEGSEEALLSFLVDAPSGVVSIGTPNPKRSWSASTDFRQRPMAIWDLLGRQLPPGGVTPDLFFEAIGLPGISTYWAGGKFKLPTEEDAADTAVDDPLTNEMINGVTVGVEPSPADRSPAALLKRLRTLTNSSCTAPMLWINDKSLCSRLLSALDRAEISRSSRQPTQMKEALAEYSALLTALSGDTRVASTSAAYWLLKSNAEIIKGSL